MSRPWWTWTAGRGGTPPRSPAAAPTILVVLPESEEEGGLDSPALPPRLMTAPEGEAGAPAGAAFALPARLMTAPEHSAPPAAAPSAAAPSADGAAVADAEGGPSRAPAGAPSAEAPTPPAAPAAGALALPAKEPDASSSSGATSEDESDAGSDASTASSECSAAPPAPLVARLDDTLAGCLVKLVRVDCVWFFSWLCCKLPAHVGVALWRTRAELADFGPGVALMGRAEADALRRRLWWWWLLTPACTIERVPLASLDKPPTPSAADATAVAPRGLTPPASAAAAAAAAAKASAQASAQACALSSALSVSRAHSGASASADGAPLLPSALPRSDAAAGGAPNGAPSPVDAPVDAPNGVGGGGGASAARERRARSLGGAARRVSLLLRLAPRRASGAGARGSHAPRRLLLVWWRWALIRLLPPAALSAAALGLRPGRAFARAALLRSARGWCVIAFCAELLLMGMWGWRASAERWVRAVLPHADARALEAQGALWRQCFRAECLFLAGCAAVLAAALLAVWACAAHTAWPGAFLGVPLLGVCAANCLVLSPWSPVRPLRRLLYGPACAAQTPGLLGGVRADALPPAVRGQLPPAHYLATMRVCSILYDCVAWSALALTPTNPISTALNPRLASALSALSLLALPEVRYERLLTAVSLCVTLCVPVALACDAAGHRLTAIFLAEFLADGLSIGITRTLFRAFDCSPGQAGADLPPDGGGGGGGGAAAAAAGALPAALPPPQPSAALLQQYQPQQAAAQAAVQQMLDADPSVQCWRGAHLELAALALCVLLPYFVASALGKLLFQRRQTLVVYDSVYWLFYSHGRAAAIGAALFFSHHRELALGALGLINLVFLAWNMAAAPCNVAALNHLRSAGHLLSLWCVGCGLAVPAAAAGTHAAVALHATFRAGALGGLLAFVAVLCAWAYANPSDEAAALAVSAQIVREIERQSPQPATPGLRARFAQPHAKAGGGGGSDAEGAPAGACGARRCSAGCGSLREQLAACACAPTALAASVRRAAEGVGDAIAQPWVAAASPARRPSTIVPARTATSAIALVLSGGGSRRGSRRSPRAFSASALAEASEAEGEEEEEEEEEGGVHALVRRARPAASARARWAHIRRVVRSAHALDRLLGRLGEEAEPGGWYHAHAPGGGGGRGRPSGTLVCRESAYFHLLGLHTALQLAAEDALPAPTLADGRRSGARPRVSRLSRAAAAAATAAVSSHQRARPRAVSFELSSGRALREEVCLLVGGLRVHTLSLAGCFLGIFEWATLCRAAERNASLRCLRLARTGCDNDACLELRLLLTNARALRELDVRSNPLADKGARALARGLAESRARTLTALDVRGCRVSVAGGRALLLGVLAPTASSALALHAAAPAAGGLDGGGGGGESSAAWGRPRLRLLSGLPVRALRATRLHRTHAAGGVLQPLGGGGSSGRSAALLLPGASLGEAECAVLTALLPRARHVRALTLRHNALGPSAAELLALELARDGCALTSLELSANPLGDAGARALARGLRHSESLRELGLARCGIGPVGRRALGEAALANASSALASVALDQWALYAGTSALRVPHAGLGPADAPLLCAPLRRHACVQVLDLSYNALGDVGAGAVARALLANASLTLVDLTATQIGAAGAASLARALAPADSDAAAAAAAGGRERRRSPGLRPRRSSGGGRSGGGGGGGGGGGAAAAAGTPPRARPLCPSSELGGAAYDGADRRASLPPAGPTPLQRAASECRISALLAAEAAPHAPRGGGADGGAGGGGAAHAHSQRGRRRARSPGAERRGGALGARARSGRRGGGGDGSRALRVLRLGFNALPAEALPALCAAIADARNGRLEELSLAGAPVGEACAKYVGLVLRHRPSLTRLDLSFCGLTDGGMGALALALEANGTLRALDIRGNELTAMGRWALARSLEAHGGCALAYVSDDQWACAEGEAELLLAGARMSDADAGLLGAVLRANECAQVLTLGANGLSAYALQCVGRMLHHNSTLQVLDLSHNAQPPAEGGRPALYSGADELAEALARALVVNTSLRVLRCAACALGTAAAVELGHALASNAHLTDLDLGYNQVGDAGCSALASALGVRGRLARLSLAANGITAIGARALCQLLDARTRAARARSEEDAEAAAAAALGLRAPTAPPAEGGGGGGSHQRARSPARGGGGFVSPVLGARRLSLGSAASSLPSLRRARCSASAAHAAASPPPPRRPAPLARPLALVELHLESNELDADAEEALRAAWASAEGDAPREPDALFL